MLRAPLIFRNQSLRLGIIVVTEGHPPLPLTASAPVKPRSVSRGFRFFGKPRDVAAVSFWERPTPTRVLHAGFGAHTGAHA